MKIRSHSKMHRTFHATRAIGPNSGEIIWRIGHPAVVRLTPITYLLLEDQLRAEIEAILDDATLTIPLHDMDRVQVVILDGTFTIPTTMRPRGEMNADVVLEAIISSLTSIESLTLENMRILVRYARLPAGGSYLKPVDSVHEFLKRKGCIVQITSTVNTHDCFWQCLGLGLAQLEEEKTDAWKRLVCGGYKQKNRRKTALDLMRDTLLTHPIDMSQPVSMHEFASLETLFNVQINILAFEGLAWLRTSKGERMIYLLLVEDNDAQHYHYINRNKVGAVFSNQRFCTLCMKSFRDVSHRCIPKCYACHDATCDGIGKSLQEANVLCNRCNLVYFGEECMERHRKTCGKYGIRCKRCHCLYKKEWNDDRGHRCHWMLCKTCDEYIPINEHHECFVQVIEELEDAPMGILVWDIECLFNALGEHEVACVVTNDLTGEDGIRVFYTMQEFCKHILSKQFENYTVLAHNSARYDSHFLKRYFLSRRIKTYDTIQGSKIFCMRIPRRNIRFLDSYHFIPIALRRFPKTFGFSNVTKGYFPYRFFTVENRDYQGPLPSMDWFDFDCLSAEERQSAIRWYEENKDTEVNLLEMCIEYCKDDVRVLGEGVMAFVRVFLNITRERIHPFNSMTIAGLCSTIYRTLFMPQNAIAILNPNPREKDLFLEDGTRVLRCLDIGCSRCFKSYTLHPLTCQPMRIYDEEFRRNPIAGVRQCELKRPVRSDALQIDHAFFGGRTEAIKLWYKVRPGERIRYFDYTSLYPFVMRCRGFGITPLRFQEERTWVFPVGHPQYLLGQDLNRPLFTYFGFAKVLIRAPRDLYFPVLPRRDSGKLMFDLPREPFIGCWTIVELEKAVEKGYEILEIVEVCHFEETSSDLFRDYVDTFMKMKNTAKIENNPGMYFITKLCLNSLWGKFAQRSDRASVLDTFTEADFLSFIFTEGNEIRDVYYHTPNIHTITYRKLQGFDLPSRTTNRAVASFVTAYGRLRLYEALDILKERVLYVDTDSVIWVEQKYDDSLIQLGDRLGDFTDELDPGDYIEEFMSSGAKSYAYITHLGKTVCKVKGVSLNFKNACKLNETTLREIALDERDVIEVDSLKFNIGKDHRITTASKNRVKRFRKTFDKREIQEKEEHQINSKPFGME